MKVVGADDFASLATGIFGLGKNLIASVSNPPKANTVCEKTQFVTFPEAFGGISLFGQGGVGKSPTPKFYLATKPSLHLLAQQSVPTAHGKAAK